MQVTLPALVKEVSLREKDTTDLTAKIAAETSARQATDAKLTQATADFKAGLATETEAIKTSKTATEAAVKALKEASAKVGSDAAAASTKLAAEIEATKTKAITDATIAKDAAVANADQGVTLQKAADQVPMLKSTLSNMDSLLDKFTSGPGADWAKVGTAGLNTALQALGAGAGINVGPVASQEDFNKQTL